MACCCVWCGSFHATHNAPMTGVSCPHPRWLASRSWAVLGPCR
jgi:hypothetical protein